MYLTRAQGPEGVPFKGARCILRGCKHSCCMFRKYLDTMIFLNDCRLSPCLDMLRQSNRGKGKNGGKIGGDMLGVKGGQN